RASVAHCGRRCAETATICRAPKAYCEPAGRRGHHRQRRRQPRLAALCTRSPGGEFGRECRCRADRRRAARAVARRRRGRRRDGAPALGICLGMQLLFEPWAEGDTACLGVIDGQIERLRAAPGLPVPHMGWNTLEIQCEDPLLAGISAADRLYFVRSYAAPVCEGTLA